MKRHPKYFEGYDDGYDVGWEAGVKYEKERCARICEALSGQYEDGTLFLVAAQAIREGGGE